MIMNHLWKNRWWLIVWFTVLALCPPVRAEAPVVVGVLHREDFAYAKMMRTAFEMALEEINAVKGVSDRTVKLAFADDRGDPKTGEQAVRELVLEKKAVMLVGGYSSSNTLKMAFAANRLNIPFLVCTAADDRITQHKLKNIYRLNPPVSEYTKGLEKFLQERIKPASMSIVYENSPFGTGSAMRMMWFCRENDIAIKAIQPYFKEGATSDDMQRILTPIRNDPPDVLFMSSYLKDAILLVNKISELGIKSLLCGGAGGFTHDDFPGKTATASQYLLTATLWSPPGSAAQANDFSQRFNKRHGKKPDYHAVEAYSALLVAATAIRKSPSLSPADIRSTIESTRMETPFGEVAFTDYSSFQRQNVSNTPVLQVINGKFETVWPPHLKTADFIEPSR
jgi:branched-chain amino acid transport system substrate-binding protein